MVKYSKLRSLHSLINIKFQNTDFLIAVKPADMNFHSENGEAGFMAQLKQHILDQFQDKEIETLLYPVHRLDKMTSGLIIVALSLEAAQAFQVMFSERQVNKFYLAVSEHKPKKKQGWVKGDMAPARNGNWKLCKTQNNPAITQFISASLQPKERLYLLKPLSGKTHQLRVMMKSIGASICGDRRYAPKTLTKQEERGYLHAFALQFTWKGEIFQFTQAPDSGSRFLSLSCQDQLVNWSCPWQFFT